MSKRKFTQEEKLNILEEAQKNGVSLTLDNHGIYPATYYNWKKKYETLGEAGFRTFGLVLLNKYVLSKVRNHLGLEL